MNGDRFNLENVTPEDMAGYIASVDRPLTDAEIKGALLLMLRRLQEVEARAETLRRRADVDSLEGGDD